LLQLLVNLSLAFGLVGCHSASPEAGGPSSGATFSSPMATPAPASHADGAVESMELIIRSAKSEYCRITYWSDGLRVKGFLGRPMRGTSLPAVILNRGGNREESALRGPEIVPFVESGFVAVASQYRGNGGSEGREEFGGADVDDVLNLVPLLKSLPEVDPERIGMMGWSRGGMMTYLALKRETLKGTHDIKVAATVAGPTDLLALAHDRPDMLDVYFDLIGQLLDEAPYRARSAVFWPELINAPLLIQHGEEDIRVSVEQSRRLAELLAREGKTVKLVTYPGDEHMLPGHNWGYPQAMAWIGKAIGRPDEDHSFETHQQAIEAAVRAWPK
jgi:dipeptidyl aminopeptidase/acylaminoacyl peptidase